MYINERSFINSRINATDSGQTIIIKYFTVCNNKAIYLLRCNCTSYTYVYQLIDWLRLSFDVICAKDFEVNIVHLSAHSFHSTSSVTRFFTSFHWSVQCNVVHLHSPVWLPNVFPFASKNSLLSLAPIYA